MSARLTETPARTLETAPTRPALTASTIEGPVLARGAFVRWTAHVVLWLALVAIAVPGLLRMSAGFSGATVVAAFAVVCGLLFLFYAAYHYTSLGSALVRRVVRNGSTSAMPDDYELPPVAVIVTICDDFSEDATRTILESVYPNLHLYLCDDSQTSSVRERVNRFADAAPAKVTVIRRDHRTGYKAGNVNHALRSGLIDEELLLLADADERLERFHLHALVQEFQHRKPAFLQASHRSGGNESRFQQLLAPTVATYWTVYEQARNWEGFPLYLSHGVVVPRWLLEELGGFTEQKTSEDIEFTYRLAISPGRRARGRVSEEIFAMEEVPMSLRRYKLRFARWTRQDLRLAPSALAYLWQGRGRVSGIEAFDLLVKQFHFPVWGLGEIYAFAFAVLLLVGSDNAAHAPTLAAVGIFGGLAAVVPVLAFGDSTLRQRARAALGSIWLFNSLTLISTRSLIGLRRRTTDAKFIPTGTTTPLETGAQGGHIAFAVVLSSLAAMSTCLLLAAMGLGALATYLRSGMIRSAVNTLAVTAALAGVGQLLWHPEYSLALLPLGASRY